MKNNRHKSKQFASAVAVVFMSMAGTVNIKAISGEGGKITGAACMAETGVAELFAEDDPDGQRDL